MVTYDIHACYHGYHTLLLPAVIGTDESKMAAVPELRLAEVCLLPLASSVVVSSQCRDYDYEINFSELIER